MADINLRVFYCNKLINVYIWAYYPNQLLPVFTLLTTVPSMPSQPFFG